MQYAILLSGKVLSVPRLRLRESKQGLPCLSFARHSPDWNQKKIKIKNDSLQ